MSLFSLPTPLIVPRPPSTAATLDDYREWASNLVGYLTSVNFTLDALGDAFIGSSALVGDDVITTGSIQDSSITSAKVQDSGLQTIDYANSSVTTIKIQASGVTSASISASAVYNCHLTANVIQSANMSASSVYTSAVIYSAITTGAATITPGATTPTNGGFTTVASVTVTLASTDLWTIAAGSTLALTSGSAGMSVDQQIISSSTTYLTRSGIGAFDLIGGIGLILDGWTLGGTWLQGQFSSGDSGVVTLSYQIKPNAASTSSAALVVSERVLQVAQFKR